MAFCSQSQVAGPTASGAARLTWEPRSVNVRWRPLLAMAIVTHLVTRLLASLSHEQSLRRKSRVLHGGKGLPAGPIEASPCSSDAGAARMAAGGQPRYAFSAFCS